MKKAFSLLCALLLMLSPALAEGADDYIGTWMQENYNEETGYYSVEVLKLAPDFTAYYSVATFHDGKPGLSRQSEKTWSMRSSGIHIVLGENTDTNAKILSDGRLGFELAGGAYSPFVRVDSVKEKAESPDGLRVPMGEYLIGEYIPAGNYRVTLTGKDLAVVWVYKKGAFSGQYYSLVYQTGETVANIRLSDGDTFKVEHATVILSEMTGL